MKRRDRHSGRAASVAILICGVMVLPASQGRLDVHAFSPGDVAGQAPANADAKTMAEFTERVKAYAELHRKVEDTLDPLPDEATPEAIDRHQRAFADRLSKARAGARRGDVFTPEMQRLAQTLIARLFKDPRARRDLRASVMEDNPAGVKIAVNGRYPDAVPLSTMPPDILKQLPPLPEELEYRFVGDALILLDPDAHIIVDYVRRALP